MKKILILGAGLSTASLIDYLLYHSTRAQLHVRVGDLSLETVSTKVKRHSNGTPFQFDSADFEQPIHRSCKCRCGYIDATCIYAPNYRKRVCKTEQEYAYGLIRIRIMSQLHVEAESKGITLLNELGVDPGIDHMSAMKVIDEINQGGKNA